MGDFNVDLKRHVGVRSAYLQAILEDNSLFKPKTQEKATYHHYGIAETKID